MSYLNASYGQLEKKTAARCGPPLLELLGLWPISQATLLHCLKNPKPARPEPRRTMVEGSGIALSRCTFTELLHTDQPISRGLNLVGGRLLNPALSSSLTCLPFE